MPGTPHHTTLRHVTDPNTAPGIEPYIIRTAPGIEPYLFSTGSGARDGEIGYSTPRYLLPLVRPFELGIDILFTYLLDNSKTIFFYNIFGADAY